MVRTRAIGLGLGLELDMGLRLELDMTRVPRNMGPLGPGRVSGMGPLHGSRARAKIRARHAGVPFQRPGPRGPMSLGTSRARARATLHYTTVCGLTGKVCRAINFIHCISYKSLFLHQVTIDMTYTEMKLSN